MLRKLVNIAFRYKSKCNEIIRVDFVPLNQYNERLHCLAFLLPSLFPKAFLGES